MTQSMRNVYSGEKWVNSTPDRIHKNEHYYMFPIGLGVIALGSWLYYRFSKKKDMSQSAVASAAPPVNGPTVVELGDGCRLVCDDGEGEAQTVETIDEWAMYGEVPQQDSAEFVDELAAQGSYQQQSPASPGLGQADGATAPGQAGSSFGAGSVSQSANATSKVKRPLRRKL